MSPLLFAFAMAHPWIFGFLMFIALGGATQAVASFGPLVVHNHRGASDE